VPKSEGVDARYAHASCLERAVRCGRNVSFRRERFWCHAGHYLIVDRLGIRVLRNQYSAKFYVLFYTTKRVGGGVQDLDAIKLMKFDVS
jgi:hypothetical protein